MLGLARSRRSPVCLAVLTSCLLSAPVQAAKVLLLPVSPRGLLVRKQILEALQSEHGIKMVLLTA
jgi:hypothetical protein